MIIMHTFYNNNHITSKIHNNNNYICKNILNEYTIHVITNAMWRIHNVL